MGGHFALFPTVTMKVFGLHAGHKIYGFLFYSFGIASVAGIFYVRVLLPATGYTVIMWIFFAMSLVSLGLTYGFVDITNWVEYCSENKIPYKAEDHEKKE